MRNQDFRAPHASAPSTRCWVCSVTSSTWPPPRSASWGSGADLARRVEETVGRGQGRTSWGFYLPILSAQRAAATKAHLQL